MPDGRALLPSICGRGRAGSGAGNEQRPYPFENQLPAEERIDNILSLRPWTRRSSAGYEPSVPASASRGRPHGRHPRAGGGRAGEVGKRRPVPTTPSRRGRTGGDVDTEILRRRRRSKATRRATLSEQQVTGRPQRDGHPLAERGSGQRPAMRAGPKSATRRPYFNGTEDGRLRQRVKGDTEYWQAASLLKTLSGEQKRNGRCHRFEFDERLFRE